MSLDSRSTSPPFANSSHTPLLWSQIVKPPSSPTPHSLAPLTPPATPIASAPNPPPTFSFSQSLTTVRNCEEKVQSAVRTAYHMLSTQNSTLLYRYAPLFIGGSRSDPNPLKIVDIANTQALNHILPIKKTTSHRIQTAYQGLGRVAQVLRWVSSACLAASDPSITPEIQTTIVNGCILIGSNTTEENDQKIRSNFISAIQDITGFEETTQILNERIHSALPHHDSSATQKLRHLEQLYDLLHEESAREEFIQTASQESAENNETEITSTLLDGIFQALEKACKEKDFSCIEIAPIIKDSHGKPIQGTLHAEQRVIEHVQRNQDKYSKADDPCVPLIIAGSKPPCYVCSLTEHKRHDLAEKTGPSTRFMVVRFEDAIETIHGVSSAVGKLFPGKTAMADHSISKQIHSYLWPATRPNQSPPSTRTEPPKVNYPYPLKFNSPKKAPKIDHNTPSLEAHVMPPIKAYEDNLPTPPN